MHIKSCKEIDYTVDKSLKNLKNSIAKKSEEKKATIAAHKELALAAQASKTLPDNAMDIDSDQDSKV
jgi:hypothetical protein